MVLKNNEENIKINSMSILLMFRDISGTNENKLPGNLTYKIIRGLQWILKKIHKFENPHN
jgi:hypothetical protein